MKTLPLGYSLADKRPVTLPLDYATQAVAVIGRRGSGKTYCAKRIAEGLLHNHLQTIIFDPLGVWWGLRTLPDGKPSAFDRLVIFGGHYADLPLLDTAGVAIADLIVNEGLSAIISTRHLSGRGQTRFAQDFAEQLYRRKDEQAHRTPTHLMVDEADTMIPQRPMPDEMRLLSIFDKLVRYGRASGIGVTMVTQRPAVLNKNALSQAEMLVVLQITGPQDRKAVKEWVDAHDTAGKGPEFLAGLAALKRGEAWLWSPSWLDIFERVNVSRADTFDSSYTPKVGELGKAQKPPAKIDSAQLEGWKGKLAAVVAEAEASDPSKLKAKIRQLEASVEKLTRREPVGGASSAEVVQRVTAACGEARKLALAEASDAVLKVSILVAESGQRLARDVQNLVGNTLQQWKDERPSKAVNHPAQGRAAAQTNMGQQQPAVGRPARSSALTEPLGTLTKCERAILVAAVQRHPRPSTRTQLSVISGYSKNSSSFDKGLSGLRTKDCLQPFQNGTCLPTQVGYAAAGEVKPLPEGEELIQWWIRESPKCPAALLQAILNAHPDSITPVDLSTASGYSVSSSSFDKGMSYLRTLDLIQRQGDGYVINPEILES